MKHPAFDESCLLIHYLPADYCDAYSREIECERAITVDDFLDITFNQLPKWVSYLLKLRNALVKPLGLDTSSRLEKIICERNQNEIVFGMPDKHLTFHASLWCSPQEKGRQTLKITTIVTYNNRLGRFYFFIVKPFHKVIISSLLKRVEKRYNTKG